MQEATSVFISYYKLYYNFIEDRLNLPNPNKNDYRTQIQFQFDNIHFRGNVIEKGAWEHTQVVCVKDKINVSHKGSKGSSVSSCAFLLLNR